jgi:hypothetical protein
MVDFFEQIRNAVVLGDIVGSAPQVIPPSAKPAMPA